MTARLYMVDHPLLLRFMAEVPPPQSTPLLQLDNGIVLKDESVQISNSVKYRMVYARIKAAIMTGVLSSRHVLLEASSGSTALALSYVANLLQLNVEVHVYDNISVEMISCLHHYGARVVVHGTHVPFKKIYQALKARHRLHSERYWHLQQFDDVHNRHAYQSLLDEIDQALLLTPNQLRYCVVPVGTGCLFNALYHHFKLRSAPLVFYALVPRAGCVINGLRPSRYLRLGKRDPFNAIAQQEVVEIGEEYVASGMSMCNKPWSASTYAALGFIARRQLHDTLLVLPSAAHVHKIAS